MVCNIFYACKCNNYTKFEISQSDVKELFRKVDQRSTLQQMFVKYKIYSQKS